MRRPGIDIIFENGTVIMQKVNQFPDGFFYLSYLSLNGWFKNLEVGKIKIQIYHFRSDLSHARCISLLALKLVRRLRLPYSW